MTYVQKSKIQYWENAAGAHLHTLYAEMYNSKHNHAAASAFFAELLPNSLLTPRLTCAAWESPGSLADSC